MTELDQLRSSIEALAAQRAVLGDAVVDQALAPLLQRAKELEQGKWLPDEGERKHITVMFADLSGFTAMSETGDAEDIRNWVNACFSQLGDVVKRYGGYIDKFIGDELMVLFGAPRAIEDHASRALHAALGMREALATFNREHEQLRGSDLSMHFGINSGEVIAGAMGVEGRREYTVMGDTVNVAARLAARAEAGQILVGAGVRRLVGDGFTFRDVGLVELDGRREAVETSELLAGHSDAQSLREPLAAGTPMFGRDLELRTLRDIFEEVVAQRCCRSVAIVGLAGIGKSRMLREFRTWFEAVHPSATLSVGEALPHMMMTPYFMIASAIRNALNVREGESAAAIHTRLKAALSGAGMEDISLLHGLEAIMGIEFPTSGFEDLSPKDRKDCIFRAATNVIRELASPSGGVVVMAFEDLHWADDLSIELLDHVFSELSDAPVLFLATTRPILDEESRARQLELRLPKNTHTRIALTELDSSASEALVRTLAPGLDRSQHALETIVRKGQGNPFFIESVIGALLDRGVLVRGPDGVAVAEAIETVDVPETVLDVLADRIDRLPAEEKRVVQMAAIVGRLFWEGLVRELTALPAGKHLQALNQREFVDRVGPAGFGDEWEWVFRHILVQEVAYSGLLRETRRAGHLRAAEWLEERVSGRRYEYAALLAHHYEQGEHADKTAEYSELAGDRAGAIFANTEAKAYYFRALSALGKLDADLEVCRRKIDVTLKLARVSLQQQTEEVFAALEEARTLAEEIGDNERQIRALSQMASWLYISGQASPAVQVAVRAVAFGTQTGLEELLAVPYVILGRAMYLLGDHKQSVEMLEKWKALAEKGGAESDASPGLGLGPSLSFLGIAYLQLGEMVKGQALALEGLRLAEQRQDLRQIGIAHMYIGTTASIMGRLEEADEHLPRAVDILEQTSDLAILHVALGLLGYRHAQANELEAATQYLDRALTLASEIGSNVFVPVIQAFRAEVDVRAGRPEEASTRAEQAVKLAQETRQRQGEAEARRVLGWAIHFSHTGARQEAEQELRAAVKIHRETNAHVLASRTLYQLADYLRLVGDEDGAQEAEAEASATALELGLDWLPLPSPSPPVPAGLSH